MGRINPTSEMLKFWGSKEYWSIGDLLSLCYSGIEHVAPQDYGLIKITEEIIIQAVASGDLKKIDISEGSRFKRDAVVKWASKNLEHFPFIPKDFDPIPKKIKTGSNREDTQLRIIGALAILLSRSKKKYKVGEKPNKKAIADSSLELFQHLDKESLNLSGMKDSNFRGFISDGITLLFEE